MNVFGMGPLELLLILMVALIIFGPGRLPEVGQTLGKSIREFRKAVSDLSSEVTEGLSEAEFPKNKTTAAKLSDRETPEK